MLRRYLDNQLINVATMCLLFVATSLLLPPLYILKFIYVNTVAKNHARDDHMKGKVVLITGASSGIGEYMAYEYAKRGAYIVVVARREERLRQVAKKARELGSPDVLVAIADVSNVNDCKRFVDETIHRFGRLDHLVNNAGIGNAYSINDAVEVTKFASVMDINFWGSVYPTHYAIPHLRKSRGKIIVNASGAAFLHPPQGGFYCASKAALVSFYESLRVELSPEVKITIVILGLVESEITQGKQLSRRGVVEMIPEGHVAVSGYPMMSTEPCAKAIVDGACRGERYVTEPQYVRLLTVVSFLFPEFEEWYYRKFFLPKFTTAASRQQVSSSSSKTE